MLISAEEDESNVQLYEKPVPENDFVNHCIQRRKYPVLLKVDTPHHHTPHNSSTFDSIMSARKHVRFSKQIGDTKHCQLSYDISIPSAGYTSSGLCLVRNVSDDV